MSNAYQEAVILSFVVFCLCLLWFPWGKAELIREEDEDEM